MYKLKTFLTFNIVLGLLTGCSDSDNAPNIDDNDDLEVTQEISRGISLSQSEQEIANGQTKLGLSFFQKYSETIPDDNFICAPFSLSNVLAMLANGASAEVIQEINSLYGLNSSDINGLNSLHSKLLK